MFPSPLETPEDKKVLVEFKTKRCVKDFCYNRIACWFYHGLIDRRRIPVFLPNLGFQYINGKCTKLCGLLNCRFCLNRPELVYHPLLYKTRLCERHPECTFDMCPFAHGAKDLRRPGVMYTRSEDKKDRERGELGNEQEDDQLMREQLQTMEDEKAALVAILAEVQGKEAAQERKLKCTRCRAARWIGVRPCCRRLICLDCSKPPQCGACGETGHELVILYSNS